MRGSLIAFLILIPLLNYGWEPYKADVTQKAFPPGSGGADHLEPFTGQLPQTYYLIRYDVRPALDSQEAHLVISRDEISSKYSLEAWNTWSNPDQNRSASVALPPDVKIEIPQELADVAYQMWTNSLFEVRYDRAETMGLDGTEYTFSAFVRGKGWLYGKTWSPDKELPPKWMVETGENLLKLARDKNFKTDECLASLMRTHHKLFEYLKEHGRN